MTLLRPLINRLRLDWGLIAAVCMALPLIVPFLGPGLAYAADTEDHLYRIVSGIVNMQAGYIWPRWTSYLHHGFGYPLHNYHPPGMYVAGALIYVTTHFDPVTIFKLIQFFGTLLFPVGAYLFARTFTGKPGALVAAAAYTYAPFRFLELWSQMDVPQLLAMGLFPWLLWAIARGAEQRRLRWVVLIGVCLAGIIVTHHASTFFFAPFAGLYTLLISFTQARNEWKVMSNELKPNVNQKLITHHSSLVTRYSVFLRALATTIGGLAFGLMLSAVYWIPALAELDYIQIHTIQDAMFQVEANYLPLDRIVSGNVPVDRALLNWTYPYGPGGPSAGLPQVMAAIIGLLVLLPALRCNLRLKVNVVAGAVVAALCIYLITPESHIVWSIIPLAKLLQVPWRLLGVVSVAVIPGAAAIPALFPARLRIPAAAALLGIFCVATLPRLYAPLVLFEIPSPTPASTIEYEAKSGNIALTSSNEYLPRWTTERPLFGGVPRSEYDTFEWRVFIDQNTLPPGATSTKLTDHAPGTSRFQIQTPAAFTLTFRQMYFPGWRVTVDGKDAELGHTTPFGLITANVPAGTHDILIWYDGTTVQHLASAISVLALPTMLVLLLLSAVRGRRSREKVQTDQVDSESAEDPRSANRLALGVIGVIVGFVVINQAIILPYTTLFRPQSDPSTPPAQYLVHQTFGDTIELVGYDLATTSATPGNAVTVKLYWRLLRKAERPLRTAVRLRSLDGRTEWAKVVPLNPGSYNTTWWTLDKYVIDRYQLKLPSDMPPYVVYLGVAVFPLDSPYDYLKTANGANELSLTAIRVEEDRKIANDGDLTRREIKFGHTIKLLGTGQKRGDNSQQCLIFRWQQQNDPGDNYTVMIHWLDAQGQMISAADAPPLDNLYPTHLWRSGQTLDDIHCLTVPAEAKAVAIGLYGQADGQRLPAVDESGKRLPDDALVITIPAP